MVGLVVGSNIDVGKGLVMAKKTRERQPGRRRTIQVRVGEMIGCDKSDFYTAVRNSLNIARHVMNAAFSELRSRDALQPDTMFKILSDN